MWLVWTGTVTGFCFVQLIACQPPASGALQPRYNQTRSSWQCCPSDVSSQSPSPSNALGVYNRLGSCCSLFIEAAFHPTVRAWQQMFALSHRLNIVCQGTRCLDGCHGIYLFPQHPGRGAPFCCPVSTWKVRQSQVRITPRLPREGMTSTQLRSAPATLRGRALRRAPSPGRRFPGSPSLLGARGPSSAAPRHRELSCSAPAAPRRSGEAGAGRGRPFPPPLEEVTWWRREGKARGAPFSEWSRPAGGAWRPRPSRPPAPAACKVVPAGAARPPPALGAPARHACPGPPAPGTCSPPGALRAPQVRGRPLFSAWLRCPGRTNQPRASPSLALPPPGSRRRGGRERRAVGCAYKFPDLVAAGLGLPRRPDPRRFSRGRREFSCRLRAPFVWRALPAPGFPWKRRSYGGPAPPSPLCRAGQACHPFHLPFGAGRPARLAVAGHGAGGAVAPGTGGCRCPEGAAPQRAGAAGSGAGGPGSVVAGVRELRRGEGQCASPVTCSRVVGALIFPYRRLFIKMFKPN